MKEGKNLSQVSSLETFLREKFAITSLEGENNVINSMEENFVLLKEIENVKLKEAILEYFEVSNGTAKFTNPQPQNVADFSYEAKFPSMLMETKGIGIVTKFKDRVLITTTQLV